MIVLVAGAHGRLGSRVVSLLLRRGHLIRTHAQAAVLRDAGAEAVVADLSGDVEWTAEGCNAAVFAEAGVDESRGGAAPAGRAAGGVVDSAGDDFGRVAVSQARRLSSNANEGSEGT